MPRHIPENYQLKSVTVSQESNGRYYASLLFEVAECENQAVCHHLKLEHILGIDYAMQGLGVFSDGTRANYPGFYRKTQEKLGREQRRLSHCQKGSQNYYKQKRKLARCHERIRNQRNDFLHKLSHQISKEYDAVAVEDIDMKGMSQCLHLGKGVMDNGFGKFRIYLDYKLKREGKNW